MRYVLIALLLAGCATEPWRHQSGDDSRRDRDQRECNYEGAKATANSTGFASGYESARITNMCMELRGYR